MKRARIILWKGHCSVHTRFTVRQIETLRAQHPGLRVIVHPEVPWDVVQAADDSGSTEYIINQVKDSPAGSVWAVGTEIHLVNRLAHEVQPDRTVLSLDQFGCLCSTMFRVSPNHLLWILEGLVDGEVHNRIVVPDDQKHWTKVALDRMLSIQLSVRLSTSPRVAPTLNQKYDPEVLPTTDRQGGRPMAHSLPPLPYAARRARTAHRQADDGDSSRQASRTRTSTT